MARKKKTAVVLFLSVLILFGCRDSHNILMIEPPVLPPDDEGVVDYTVSSALFPSNAQTGTSLGGDFFVQNAGDGEGAEEVIWEIVLSDDAVFDLSDPSIDTGSTAALSAGAFSPAVAFTGFWPAASAGNYPLTTYLIVNVSAADDGGASSKVLVSSPIMVRLRGKILYNDTNDDMWLVNTDGSNLNQVGTLKVNSDPVSLSLAPDYSKVAYVPLGSITELWTANVDGSGSAQLTTRGLQIRSPQYSPDASAIVLWINVGVAPDDLSTANSTTGALIDSATIDNNYLTWSPDGNLVSYIDQLGQIGVANSNLSGWTLLAPAVTGDAQRPLWHPDGTKLIYVSAGDAYETTIVSPSPTLLVNLAGPSVFSPCYSPEGTQIAYIDDTAMQIVIANADGSSPQAIPGVINVGLSMEWR